MRSFGRYRLLSWLSAALAIGAGCAKVHHFHFQEPASPSYYKNSLTEIEYPNVNSCLAPAVVSTPTPFTLENPAELVTRDLQLAEAIQFALQNNVILRNLGGSVVQAPATAISLYNPAIIESNPQAGVIAALSAFDAQVTSQLFWQKNDRPVNVAINPILSQFQVFNVQQDASVFNYEIAKRTATGARFAASQNVGYDNANSPNRLFQGVFTGWFQAEYRQPLLQGSGVEFNRIAGPNGGIGNYNGVMIARINTDISLADFEQGIINFVNDVETAYWELYFTYHNLDNQVAGRNSSLLNWQRILKLMEFGASGGEAAAEAQSRSQYFLFDVTVKESLSGTNGLYAAEQRLRYLMGLPATDGALLKPTSEPMMGEVVFDWDSALNDALVRRVEIRRTKWSVKRRELELVAARLNRRPTLDVLSQYRYRGMGDSLISSNDDSNQFNSLYQSIFNGNYQEWQTGLELAYPVGLRQASAAVTNARWLLAREVALLREQELRVSHDLSNAARQVARSYQLMLTNYNRQNSDKDQVVALDARYTAGRDNINFLLQAQRDLAVSQSALFRSLVDYQLALRDFHREKGSLLNYNQVNLSEGAWPAAAYQDAYQRGRFFSPRLNPESVDVVPRPLSAGGFDPMQVGAQSNFPTELPGLIQNDMPEDVSNAGTVRPAENVDSPAR